MKCIAKLDVAAPTIIDGRLKPWLGGVPAICDHFRVCPVILQIWKTVALGSKCDISLSVAAIRKPRSTHQLSRGRSRVGFTPTRIGYWIASVPKLR